MTALIIKILNCFKKIKLGIFCIVVMATQSVYSTTDLDWVEANRETVIINIVTNLSTMAHTRGYIGWQKELTASLRQASNLTLASILSSYDYDEVTRVLRNNLPDLAIFEQMNLSFEEVIGDNDKDLVYTPLNPCRLIDTRFGGNGILNAMTTRSFSVNGNTSSQGGAANCGVPDGATEPPAVVLNITSTESTSIGFMTIWPSGKSRPNASILNFNPGQNIANSAIVTTTTLAGINEISVYVDAPTHLIVDVMGYFSAP